MSLRTDNSLLTLVRHASGRANPFNITAAKRYFSQAPADDFADRRIIAFTARKKTGPKAVDYIVLGGFPGR